LLRASFIAFRFEFGILPEHRMFTLHWTNKRRLRRIFAIRWTNDRQTDRKLNLSYLGLKTCYSLSLRLMLGFSQIPRLWSRKEICWRSHAIQAIKIHMDICYYYFSRISWLCCVPKPACLQLIWNILFDYYELYFVKMSNEWQDNENDEFRKSMYVRWWILNCIV
jgi:hypothetical protein